MMPQCLRMLFPTLGLLAFSAPAAQPDQLAYDLSTTRTNGYRITIDSPSEFQPVALEGSILVMIRPADGIGTLSFHSRFVPRPIQPQPMRGRPMHMPIPRMGTFTRNPWLSQMHMMPSHYRQEAHVDAHGRILRIPRHLDLPNPVENFLTLFFPRLPQGGAPEAQFETELIVDETSGMPMHFHHPGNPGNERLPGTRTEKVNVSDAPDGTIRLKRSVKFQSFAQTADQPRLAYSYQGEFLFDTEDGSLKSGQLEGSTSTSTLDFTQRVPVTLQFELLTGEEYQKALDQFPSLQPRILDDEGFDQKIAALTGDHPERRREAATRLMNVEISTERAAELRPAIMPLLADPEQMVRMLATKILAAGATPDDVPLLLKIATQEDFGQNFEAIQALGRLKDERAIQPLADMIASGSHNAHLAAQTLGEFGPMVEDTALQLLKEKHADTRRHACDILARVGTEKSIKPLQQLIATGDPGFNHNATAALEAIRDRIEGPARHDIPDPDQIPDPNLLL